MLDWQSQKSAGTSINSYGNSVSMEHTIHEVVQQRSVFVIAVLPAASDNFSGSLDATVKRRARATLKKMAACARADDEHDEARRDRLDRTGSIYDQPCQRCNQK